MAQKTFELTEDEINLQRDPETRGIGITGPTWEAAMRFQMEDGLRTLVGKKNTEGIIIKYVVYCPEDTDVSFENVPEEVAEMFKSAKLDKDFIDSAIKGSREFFRKHYK